MPYRGAGPGAWPADGRWKENVEVPLGAAVALTDLGLRFSPVARLRCPWLLRNSPRKEGLASHLGTMSRTAPVIDPWQIVGQSQGERGRELGDHLPAEPLTGDGQLASQRPWLPARPGQRGSPRPRSRASSAAVTDVDGRPCEAAAHVTPRARKLRKQHLQTHISHDLSGGPDEHTFQCIV